MAAAALRGAFALRLRQLTALSRANPLTAASSSPPPPWPRPAPGWRSLADAASAGRPTLAPHHPSASAFRAAAPMPRPCYPSPPPAPPCMLDLLTEAGYGSRARCSAKCGTCIGDDGPVPAAASPTTPKGGKPSGAPPFIPTASKTTGNRMFAKAAVLVPQSQYPCSVSTTGRMLDKEPPPEARFSFSSTMGTKGPVLARRAGGRPGSSPCHLHGARRSMSSAGQTQRAPPVSQVLFDNEAQVNSAEWVCSVEFLKKNSPLKSLDSNPLTGELTGTGHKLLGLSVVGISLLECLIFINLTNCNRGYCQKDYYRKENLLINPKSLQFRLKEVGQCMLDPNSRERNRMASYKAACIAFKELLKEAEGEDVLTRLSVPVKDIFIKMSTASDERLIAFHPVLLRLRGTAAFLTRIYYLVNKLRRGSEFARDLLRHIEDKEVPEIIRTHPLLHHMLLTKETMRNNSRKANSQQKTQQEQKSQESENNSVKTQQNQQSQQSENNNSGQTQQNQGSKDDESEEESPKQIAFRARRADANMMVYIPRHTIEHAFDNDDWEVKSYVDPSVSVSYTERDALELLQVVFTRYLIEAQEFFLADERAWKDLGVENFWARDLTRLGNIPAPSMKETAAICRAGLYFFRR